MENNNKSFNREQIRQHLTAFDALQWQNADGEIPFERVRFNYCNMTQLFPHAPIHRSGPVSSLHGNLNDAIGTMIVNCDNDEKTFDDYVDCSGIDGIMLLHKGEVVYQRFTGMRPFDKHLWWSISKSVTGSLIALLEDRGLLNLDQPIDTYLPELKGSGFEGVHVRDVVDMASGIDALEFNDPEAYSNTHSQYAQFEGSLGLMPKTEHTPGSPYELLPQLQSHRQSGEAFEYTSIDTFACSWLVEKIIGKPYHDIIREEIWAKIGPEADAYIMVGKDGAPASHGGISSTLGDLARYGLLYTPSWNTIATEPVFSNDYIKRIQTQGRPEIFMQAASGPFWQGIMGEELSHNCYQWDFVTRDGDFFKAGHGCQGLYVSPTKDFVAVFFAHKNAAVPIVKYVRQVATIFYC